MSATWHLVKYMSDPRRREPKNVGIILEAPNGWLAKFVGETESHGSIDGRHIRSLGLEKDVYATWVSYYRRKARSCDWNSVARLESRAHGQANFYTEVGGHYLESIDSYSDLLNRLFAELVQTPQPANRSISSADVLGRAVRAVLSRASIVPITDVKVKAKYSPSGKETEVTFPLGYRNGQLHLMEALPLSAHSVEKKARELRARMEAARFAGSANSFIAFYSSSQARDEEMVEEALLPLEDQAQTVNVDDQAVAVETIASIMAHR